MTQNIRLLAAALLVGAIVALVIYLARRKQSGGNLHGRSGADSASKDFQRLLQKGAPAASGVAMQAIEAGCQDVLRSNSSATCLDALVSTRRSLDKIVRADRH